MSKNPFTQTPPPNDVKRNTFDLSYSNNLSLKFGKLTPVMCKEVVPGDSFQIDANFGLRLMPTVFPVQSRMRADLHFFYVRNRNLWKNWKKFIGDTPNVDVTTGVADEIVSPYIAKKNLGDKFYNEGSLADYLGIPTNLIASNYQEITSFPQDYLPTSYPMGQDTIYNWQEYFAQDVLSFLSQYRSVDEYILGEPMRWHFGISDEIGVLTQQKLNNPLKADSQIIVSSPNGIFTGIEITSVALVEYRDNAYRPVAVTEFDGGISSNILRLDDERLTWFTKKGLANNLAELFEIVQYEDVKLYIQCKVGVSDDLGNYYDNIRKSISNDTVYRMRDAITISYTTESNYVTYNDAIDCYDPTNPNGIRISALPFRAYDSIFRGFYQNERVAPTIKDGKIVYDEFVLNNQDGADDTPYQLHNRYWEKDFMTTCVPSPQQGQAPLIGLAMSSYNQNPQNVDITTQTMTIDGQDAEIDVATNGRGKVIGISYYGQNVSVGSIEALESAIQYGISISDFRSVNALTRWLEINVRRGYLYKDQLLSHFGVNVSFNEMQMPEFIGGVSQDINTSAVINQSQANGATLGAFAGTASCFGKGKHKIRKYCDEHGFIIGIISVVPIPSYSQLLPKMFMKHDHLDFYFPEFNHIGYQPVRNCEITPLQQFAEDPTKMQNVFGYQRAWYEYLASYDELHGNFRSSMRNYVVNREFANTPVLSPQFIEIDNNEVNNIFAVQQDTDKIVGQVNLKIRAKRPISFFGTPTL